MFFLFRDKTALKKKKEQREKTTILHLFCSFSLSCSKLNLLFISLVNLDYIQFNKISIFFFFFFVFLCTLSFFIYIYIYSTVFINGNIEHTTLIITNKHASFCVCVFSGRISAVRLNPYYSRSKSKGEKTVYSCESEREGTRRVKANDNY